MIAVGLFVRSSSELQCLYLLIQVVGRKTAWTASLLGALASKEENKEGSLFIPWASLLKPHVLYSVNPLSHFERLRP